MKIWMDILTPKQLLFYELMAEKLEKRHKILLTSRRYGEIEGLAKIHGYNPVMVGRFGGGTNSGKLDSAISRMGKLADLIKKFSPDVAVSSCSPDAARVAFGLGIRHVAFSDSPHQNAIMRLTLPLSWKLLSPSMIPKKEFTRYGIAAKDIITYRAVDAAVTIKRKTVPNKSLPFRDSKRKNILIRVEEEEASYMPRSKKIAPIISRIIAEHGGENIVILGRYPGQVQRLKRQFGGRARVIRMSFDGKHLLENTDVFVGSGGTMTAESALLGVPTISYTAISSVIEDYLTRRRLLRKETDPGKIARHIGRILKSGHSNKKRAVKIVEQMEDPSLKLLHTIRE
ncbi:MAG: DUF354 domain-containing protein [Nitrosopumilus sp. H8]|nr:MAG: DUF354 domain-containing protein [Nitrosopumilus sp. H8]